MEEGEEDQGAALFVFMVDLRKKLNTRTNKKTKGKKRNCSVWCRHTKAENNYPQLKGENRLPKYGSQSETTIDSCL